MPPAKKRTPRPKTVPDAAPDPGIIGEIAVDRPTRQRITGFLVVLDRVDYADESIERLTHSLLLTKGVARVDPIPEDVTAISGDAVGYGRADTEWRQRVMNLLRETER